MLAIVIAKTFVLKYFLMKYHNVKFPNQILGIKYIKKIENCPNITPETNAPILGKIIIGKLFVKLYFNAECAIMAFTIVPINSWFGNNVICENIIGIRNTNVLSNVT